MFWGFKRVYRGAAPAADREATRAEAYVDFLEAQNVALRAQLAEKDAQIIRLTAKLRVAQFVQHAPDWMGAPARAARNADPDLTVVVPSPVIRRGVKGRHR